MTINLQPSTSTNTTSGCSVDEEDKREYLGSAVKNGVINFFSVSALEKADVRVGGCLRKWFYRYVVFKRDEDEEKKSVQAGKKLHREIRTYLRTGDMVLGALAASGLHMIPDPGPDLLVEQSIGGPRAPLLTAAGIPLVGFIDCAHDRAINKGAWDVTDIYDPTGTIEVIDWKWKGDGGRSELFLQPAELVKTIQMAGYGTWVSRVFPRASYVRLSHGYFPATKRKPFKSTKLHVLEEPARQWEYVEGLGRVLRDVARETDPDRVDANINGCGKYGGCPYRDRCSAYKAASTDKSTAFLFGETASKEIRMSLMSNLPPVLQQQAQPQQIVTPSATLPQVTIDPRAQLLAEEQAQRAAVQQQQQSGGVPPEFVAACQTIQVSGRGFPSLGGAAAQLYAAMGGQSIAPGSTFTGLGDLGGLQLVEPAHVVQLAAELGARQPAPAAPTPVPPPVQHVQHAQQPISILPPDAPASNPALAAKPVEGFGPAVVLAQQLPAQMIMTTAAAPSLPAQQFALAASQAPAQALAIVAAAEQPKKRGRKTKAEKALELAAASGGAGMLPLSPSAPSIQNKVNAESDLEVFADAIPNCDYESLQPYIDKICAALCSKFCPPPCLPDVRCAPKDGPLGFGGWRGAIHAIVLEQPPVPGTYYIDTASEINVEVATALHTVCDRAGGLFVQGVAR